MPMRRSNAAVAVLANRIYIISGRLGTGATPSTTPRADVYDPVKQEWLEVSSVKQARIGAEACVVNNKIYLIGGASGGKATNSVEVYDPDTDRWVTSFTLRQPRSDHSCEVLGSSIYVMGGASRPSFSAMLTSVEELAPSSVGAANRR